MDCYKVEIVKHLLEEAMRRIEHGEIEAVGWRLADALGYVRAIVTEKSSAAVCGIHYPTGLGNSLRVAAEGGDAQG
jgi:hypothetical protein